MSTFFDHHIGPACEQHVEVTDFKGSYGHVIQLSTERDLFWATPEQAKKLGRALIKAGKFVDKNKGSK